MPDAETPASPAAAWVAGPAAVAAAVVALGLSVAPLVYHHYDVVDCFLAWSRASAGWRPWDIYLTDFQDDCDYPPVVPYLLTMVEAARRLARAPEVGAFAITLVKLPNLLAVAALVPLCMIGLRRPFGARQARVAAILGGSSVPLLVNAAAWGQFDALLTLFVVAGIVALLNGKPA